MQAYQVLMTSDDKYKIPKVECPDCKGRGWVPYDEPMGGYYAPQVYGEPYNDRMDCEVCNGMGEIDEDPWGDYEDASDN